MEYNNQLNYYEEEFVDDDNQLGYFDSEEEFDDTLYLNEPQSIIQINEPYSNIPSSKNECEQHIFNIKSMKLPLDMMKEILLYTDIPTYIKLCSSSSTIKNLCTNNLWKFKFEQYNIKIYNNPTTFTDWLRLYNEHVKQLSLYKNANCYIRWMLPKHKSIYIQLEKPINDNQLFYILKYIGSYTNHPDLAKRYSKNSNNIYIARGRSWNDMMLDMIYVENYILTEEQLIDFIHQLFVNNYLDKNKVYC